MKKIILISLAVVVVLLIGAVVLVVSRIDSIVQGTVEKEGTAQLDLATTLGDADVSIFGGSLTLDDLAIANPDGYKSPVLFELGQVNVGVNYGDLMDNPVRVRDININSPRLVIERSAEGLANINLRDLMARLDTSSEEPTTKLLIDKLTVTGTNVVIRPNIEGLDAEYSVTIPDVTLTEIGTADEAQNGAEIGRVVTEVAMALAREAAASEDLPPELQAILAGDLSSILDEYKGKLRQEVQARLQEELGELEQKLGPELTGAAQKLLEGDGANAVEQLKQQGGDAVREEIEKGLGDKGLGGLLGGRRKSEDPTTKPDDQR